MREHHESRTEIRAPIYELGVPARGVRSRLGPVASWIGALRRRARVRRAAFRRFKEGRGVAARSADTGAGGSPPSAPLREPLYVFLSNVYIGAPTSRPPPSSKSSAPAVFGHPSRPTPRPVSTTPEKVASRAATARSNPEGRRKGPPARRSRSRLLARMAIAAGRRATRRLATPIKRLGGR